MFKIKICGITNCTDALCAADAGADAIGLNFYSRSPRCISTDSAKAIRDAVGNRASCVGVFVNGPPERILSIAAQVGLDAIQLHGDEMVALLNLLTDRPVVKAFRIKSPSDTIGDNSRFGSDLAAVADFIMKAQTMQSTLSAVLLDAFHPSQFGGTGQILDADTLAAHIDILQGFPWILAGGLKPENVARAIESLKPHGVDSASGVEVSPGIKDAWAVRQFVTEARKAFEALGK